LKKNDYRYSSLFIYFNAFPRLSKYFFDQQAIFLRIVQLMNIQIIYRIILSFSVDYTSFSPSCVRILDINTFFITTTKSGLIFLLSYAYQFLTGLAFELLKMKMIRRKESENDRCHKIRNLGYDKK